jgi:Flp pilus assembly protein TadG
MLNRRRRDDDVGAAAVEFALVSLPFIILVFGMIQYGWYFYVSQSTGGAASNVARRLQVGDCWGSGEATALAQSQASMVNGVTVTPSGPVSSLHAGDQITVQLTSDGRILGLIPMPNNGQVSKIVKAQIEDTTPSGSC